MSEASSFLPLTQSQDTNSSIATGGNKSSAPSIELPPNSHIITSSYIAKYTNGVSIRFVKQNISITNMLH